MNQDSGTDDRERRPSWYRATPWWRRRVSMPRYMAVGLWGLVVIDFANMVIGWLR